MRPESETELADLIREAQSPISVIGGGTRLLPGEGRGAPLTTVALTGVTLYEPEALTLVVRAGTPLAEVTALLASEGQMLAFEPSQQAGSTIGGVAAANASGPRRVQAGAARDCLIGLRFVDGEGRILRNGGRVMKNVTGYDLVKLLAGSRGRLGVLTELGFRTAPLPPESVTLSLPGLDPVAALPVLTAALGGPFDVSGAGWLPGHGAVLRVEGLAGSVAIRRAALVRLLAPFGEVQTDATDPWRVLAAPVAGAGEDLWRIICRPSEAPGLLRDLPQPLAIDWGGALIWIALPAGEVPRMPQFSGQAQRTCGTAPMMVPPPDPIVARLNDGLAARFDPRGIFAANVQG